MAYPNSGETWDALERAWHGPPAFAASSVQQWTAAGARLVGGCCRVLPETIAAVGSGRRCAMSARDLRPTNWAGNVVYSAARFSSPSSVPELQELVASSERIRARGTGHSFNAIADTTGDSVSLAAMPAGLSWTPNGRRSPWARGSATASSRRTCKRHGFALPNLGSLPHISVGGACATGTHGSGRANGVLATSVSALDMVTADGSLAHVSREADGDELAGSVIGLGSLGIVTTLTLDVVPTFDVRQVVYDDLPEAELDRHFDEILSAAYSVSLFSTWTGAELTRRG